MKRSLTKLGFLVFLFVLSAGIRSGLGAIDSTTKLSVDISDPVGDVTNSVIDIVQVIRSDTVIEITFDTQSGFEAGSYHLILLFSSSGDPSSWDAGFILSLTNGFPTIFWNNVNLDNSASWTTDIGSNDVIISDKISITYVEYLFTSIASLVVIALNDYDPEQIDWAPDEYEPQFSYTKTHNLVNDAEKAAYSNNVIQTSSVSASSSSISTANGFSTSLVIFCIPFLIITIRKRKIS